MKTNVYRKVTSVCFLPFERFSISVRFAFHGHKNCWRKPFIHRTKLKLKRKPNRRTINRQVLQIFNPSTSFVARIDLFCQLFLKDNFTSLFRVAVRRTHPQSSQVFVNKIPSGAAVGEKTRQVFGFYSVYSHTCLL